MNDVTTTVTTAIQGKRLTVRALKGLLNALVDYSEDTEIKGRMGDEQRDGPYYKLWVTTETGHK